MAAPGITTASAPDGAERPNAADWGMTDHDVAFCPHCGEPVDTYPDPGGGDVQQYVEDCAVCCRPLVVFARRIEGTQDYVVQVSAES